MEALSVTATQASYMTPLRCDRDPSIGNSKLRLCAGKICGRGYRFPADDSRYSLRGPRRGPTWP